MKKKYILKNIDNNKYWTGRYAVPYSADIRDAEQFNSEQELQDELAVTDEENYSVRRLFDEVYMFEVGIIYVNEK